MNDRFWQKVDEQADGCWLWTAYKNHGYGRFMWQGRLTLAHRITYEAAHGPVPDGYELDHLCRNRACVNPAHMEVVTHAENMKRGHWATKTTCAKGHPLEGDNLLVTKKQRVCLMCKRTVGRAYVQRTYVRKGGG